MLYLGLIAALSLYGTGISSVPLELHNRPRLLFVSDCLFNTFLKLDSDFFSERRMNEMLNSRSIILRIQIKFAQLVTEAAAPPNERFASYL